MLFRSALGCIQSLHCHTDRCPTGVATQDSERQKALHVPDKLERVARFHEHTLEALKELVQAAGLQHPNDITASHIMRRSAGQGVRPLSSELSFVAPGALLQAAEGRSPWPAEVFATHWPRARSDSFAAA